MDLPVHQQLILIASVAVLGAAATLNVRGEEQVTLPLANIALPPLCTSQRLFGIDCPGCGLTRCFVSVAHGNLNRAWHFNPAGVLLFGFIAAQVPYRLWQIWRAFSGKPAIDLEWLTVWVLVILAGGLILQWIVRLFMTGGTA